MFYPFSQNFAIKYFFKLKEVFDLINKFITRKIIFYFRIILFKIIDYIISTISLQVTFKASIAVIPINLCTLFL